MIDHPKFKAELIESDIFYIQFKPNMVCDVEDFKDSVAAYVNLGEGRIIKTLAIFPDFTDITVKAREYLQDRPIPAIAEAIVLKSLAQKLIFDYYKAFRTSKYPIKGFRSSRAAKKWLKEFS